MGLIKHLKNREESAFEFPAFCYSEGRNTCNVLLFVPGADVVFWFYGVRRCLREV